MSETQIEIVIGLLIVAIPLVAFARRAMIPYPIALVLGGLALGFVPGLPTVHLDPDLVLLIFLPPLLYWEAITAPTDVMLANLNQIGSLAIVLVVVTTVAVAVVAHAVIPEMPWAVAFVLGAVVAPTDELASAPVLERFRIPRHVIAIVEGESLVNDALSLVLYAVALTAATTGAFYLGRTALYLIVAPIGSILVGLIVGRVAVEGWRRIRDTELQSVISLLVPFVAYVPALRIGASGVLGVVTTGVFVNRFTPIVLTPESRLRLIGFWETFVFVANALLFLLVGLQLHDIAVRVFASDPWQTVLWATIATNVVVIVVRFVWILGTEFVPFIGASSEHSDPDWRHATIVAWSGLRGAVSLAAALAIPLTVASGAPFPHRDLIIFLTFSVIVVTLVGGGLTLPAATMRLNVADDDRETREDLQRALSGATKAALDRIEAMEREGRIDPRHASLLRVRYAHVLDGSKDLSDPTEREDAQRRSSAEREVIEAERAALIGLRARGEIDNTVLRRVTLALDLAHTRIRH